MDNIEALGTYVGSIATPMPAAEKARVGMPVMATAAGAELERLRALLKEAHGSLRSVSSARFDGDLIDRLEAEFKVDPAPLPYKTGGLKGRSVMDTRGAVLATVSGHTPGGPDRCDEEGKATAEFIAAACNNFPLMREALRQAHGEIVEARRSFAPARPYALDLGALEALLRVVKCIEVAK